MTIFFFLPPLDFFLIGSAFELSASLLLSNDFFVRLLLFAFELPSGSLVFVCGTSFDNVSVDLDRVAAVTSTLSVSRLTLDLADDELLPFTWIV